MKRGLELPQGLWPAFGALAAVAIPADELIKVVADALTVRIARPWFNNSIAIFPKAARELRTTATALERIRPLLLEINREKQMFAMFAAARAVFGEQDLASKLEAADEETCRRAIAIARCLDPAVLPGALRALADVLDRCASLPLFKRGPGRPSGNREFARRLSALIKMHTGKPHHREAAKLYSTIIGHNISAPDFARLTRN
jgi:hypothetical protein